MREALAGDHKAARRALQADIDGEAMALTQVLVRPERTRAEPNDHDVVAASHLGAAEDFTVHGVRKVWRPL